MDFNLTEEQKILRDTACSFLESECPGSFVREMEQDEMGFTKELWNKMAELGWMGLIIPEKFGGVGGNFLDLLIMLEEMGRVCLPGPFFSTIVLGALTIMESGDESQQQEFLPKIAKGELIWTLAHTEPCMTKYDPFYITVKATSIKDGFIVGGTKLFVPDAHVADYLICVTRTSEGPRSIKGISLFILDKTNSKVQIIPIKTIAGDKQFEVFFNEVQVPTKNLLGELNEGGSCLKKVLQKAAICKCAEMVGGARKVLEMATAYAKEREQFGKPIGSFQAIQHHCANMLMDIEGSRYITYKAGWMLSKDMPCSKEIASAKVWVGEAYKRVVRLGHQVLGGTGYIIEHDMPLYSRRAKTWETAFGDTNFYRMIVAQEIGL